MYWYVYLDKQCIGFVVAADAHQAFERAEAKFGPYWGLLEVAPRADKTVNSNNRVSRASAP
jgi:hypothetical protein